MKGGIKVQINFMDVRLDERRLPYAVHEAVEGYVGDCGMRIRTPESAVQMLNSLFHMKDFAEERIYIILMSNSCDVIAVSEVSRGVIDRAPVGIREILQRVLLCNASRLILVHNHPELGVTPYPSKEDTLLTEKLQEACGLMRIVLCDHLIIAENNFYSFTEEKMRKKMQEDQKAQEEQKKQNEQEVQVC